MANEAKRPIVTTYLNHKGELMKATRAKYAGNAVVNAVQHMQYDDYGAHLCEVYDALTGTLHAVLKKGTLKLEIVFKRDPRSVAIGETK